MARAVQQLRLELRVETHFMRMIQEGYYPSSQFR